MIKKLKSSSPCEIMSCSLKHHKMSPDAAKTQENSDICCSRNQSLLVTSRPPNAPPAAAERRQQHRQRHRQRHLPALPPPAPARHQLFSRTDFPFPSWG